MHLLGVVMILVSLSSKLWLASYNLAKVCNVCEMETHCTLATK